MSFVDKLKSGINKVKVDIAASRAADNQISQKARAARLQAREEQEIRYARESERIKTDQRLKSLRSPHKSTLGGSMSSGGLWGPSLLGNSPGMGGMLFGQSSAPKKKHRRRPKVKYEYVRVPVKSTRRRRRR